jgi:hypothetical protein
VVGLEIPERIRVSAYAAATTLRHEKGVVQGTRKHAAASELVPFDRTYVGEAVRADLPPLRVADLEGLQWDSKLTNVTSSARCVRVIVERRQFFGRDVTVLENVLEHSSRAFLGDRLDTGQQLWWNLRAMATGHPCKF